MRKLYLLILALFISVFMTPLHAQKVGNFDVGKTFVTSIDLLKAEADSLAAFLNKGYQFVQEEHFSGFYTAGVTRTYKSSEGRLLKIDIDKAVAGGNDALEIGGKTYYHIASLSGKYKDLFSIWHLLNPKADIVKTSKFDYASTVVRPSFLTHVGDMITFGPAIWTDGTHRDVWNIKFLLHYYLQKKFGGD